MRNPFEKNDHKILIAGILIGAAAAGAAFYFFRDELSGVADSLFGKEPEPETYNNPQAYLHHKGKPPKTDRENLPKYEFLHPQAAANDTAHHSEQRT